MFTEELCEVKDDPICQKIGPDVCDGNLTTFGNLFCASYCEQCTYNETLLNSTSVKNNTYVNTICKWFQLLSWSIL